MANITQRHEDRKSSERHVINMGILFGILFGVIVLILLSQHKNILPVCKVKIADCAPIIWHLTLNEWGDFLAGTGSIFALIALIVTINLQRIEIRHQQEEISISNKLHQEAVRLRKKDEEIEKREQRQLADTNRLIEINKLEAKSCPISVQAIVDKNENITGLSFQTRPQFPDTLSKVSITSRASDVVWKFDLTLSNNVVAISLVQAIMSLDVLDVVMKLGNSLGEHHIFFTFDAGTQIWGQTYKNIEDLRAEKTLILTRQKEQKKQGIIG